ncbi:MAG: hypothetical protein JWQ23_3002 [Herminiimonas sp.]|nr:hypothetical protein [Herminiimonas sp.]
MEDRNAQMALRLHQITGEPLAHCNYLLGQTNGDYEIALKILERILQHRKAEPPDQNSADAPSGTAPMPERVPQTLEERVEQMEIQLAYLTLALNAMREHLMPLLDKLSGSGSASQS